MFDCVLPTRCGRNGTAYTWRGRVNLKGARFADEMGPVDPDCGCAVCAKYSAAYIRHLVRLNEMLASRLLTYHNLYFYHQMMLDIRHAIREDRYPAFKSDRLERLRRRSA
jgi:queuine tRNA-ribosyltransferase